jgi:large conductance mechanosensitive channel
MWVDFREFLLKQNALALAIGVIIGGAIGKVVTSLVSDILMPIIGLALPGGAWREAKFVLSQTTGADGKLVESAINYGAFMGTIVDFVIVAFVVFLIMRRFLAPAPAAPVKACPFCLESVPTAATRCRACGSDFVARG